MSTMAMGDLDARYIKLLQQELLRGGLSLDPEADRLFQELIRSGVERMRHQGITQDVLDKAEQNLLAFIGSAKQEAFTLRSQKIDASIFRKIKKLLCPIYPWC